MQLLNCLLALGGDQGNSVPKPRITTAEAHVLRAIHGPEAVHDVEPLDEEAETSTRAEIARLAEKYPARNEDGKSVVATVYAGGGAAMPMTVEALELPETCFKVLSRVVAKPTTKRAKKTKVDDPDMFG